MVHKLLHDVGGAGSALLSSEIKSVVVHQPQEQTQLQQRFCISQVHKLRQEKDVLEGKLKEFERSLQKLKDCTYQEATQKREYERRVQAAQADLRGANLREQV